MAGHLDLQSDEFREQCRHREFIRRIGKHREDFLQLRFGYAREETREHKGMSFRRRTTEGPFLAKGCGCDAGRRHRTF